MREYSFKINEKMLNGLRVHHTNPRNSGSLVDCMNILPTEYGLLSYEAAISLFEDEYYYNTIPPIEWPFPQMLLGYHYSILCFKTKIYSIETIGGLTISSLVYDCGSQPTWNESNTWHFADFYDFIVITNGEVLLQRNPTTNTWQAISIGSAMPQMGTICNFKGQLIGGNITSDWYDCDEASVVWSNIGSIDMIPDQSNLMGYMPMPFKGDIYKVLPLDNNVIVYGDGGIAALIVGEVTFGNKLLASYGILSRDAVFGTNDRHIFIDESGWLRSIGKDLTITRIGYQEFFETMAGTYPMINYDNVNGRYYISNGTDNYVYSSHGLSKCYQTITSGEFIQGGFVGNIDTSTTDDLEYRVTLDTFDIGFRGQKTIESIEIGSNQSSDCYVSIDYRFSKQDAWTTTREVICNKEGIVKLPCAGIEFRFNLRFTSYIDVNLDYIDIKYKSTDKRTARGTKHAIASTS